MQGNQNLICVAKSFAFNIFLEYRPTVKGPPQRQSLNQITMKIMLNKPNERKAFLSKPYKFAPKIPYKLDTKIFDQ